MKLPSEAPEVTSATHFSAVLTKGRITRAADVSGGTTLRQELVQGVAGQPRGRGRCGAHGHGRGPGAPPGRGVHGGGRVQAWSPGGPGKGQQQVGRPRDTGQSPSSAFPSIPVLCFLPAVPPSDGSSQGLGLGELSSERNQCAHRALASVSWEGLKDTKGLQGDGHGDEATGARGGCRRIAGHVSTVAKFRCEGDGEAGAGGACGGRKSLQCKNRRFEGLATATGSKEGHR